MIINLYIILVVIFLLLLNSYKKYRRFWKLANEFKGDKTLPFIGNTYQFPLSTNGIFDKLEKIWECHGRSTYKLILGTDVFIMLSDPETVEVILSNNKEIDKLDDYKYWASWLGDGLLLSSGDKWRRQRKTITPTFHFKILEQFVHVFNSKADILTKKLYENTEEIFDIYPFITLCTLDIICESSMGININSQYKSDSEYVKAVYRINEILTHRQYSTWKRFSFLYRFSSDYKEEQKLLKTLHNTTHDVIRTRKFFLSQYIVDNDDVLKKLHDDAFSGRKKVAFLDLLLLSKTPEGQPLSDNTIREEVDTFMFEGHDTTSSALSFALYLLANNPIQQNLAFEEQFSIFGNDLEKQPTYRDLHDMKYLDRVIKETLRLYPSVPLYGRKIKNDLRLPDGRILPSGICVGLQIYFMNRNPKYFPDPLKFNPDRFLPENSRNNHPFLYVPFSAGPRNCIGQKFAILVLKSVLSKVLRCFELFSAGADFEPLLASEAILKSKNGINLQFRNRMLYIQKNICELVNFEK